MPDVRKRLVFVTGDVAGHGSGTVPGRKRLPLDSEAVPAAGSGARRARDAGLELTTINMKGMKVHEGWAW